MSERAMIRTGWILSLLYGAFMLLASALPKLAGMEVAADTMAGLGWPDAPVLMIGIMELACTLLYLYPATSLLGAVLSMAIFGGAMATQLRAGSPLASHQLFSLWLGIVMWAGLWLRSPRVRDVFPLIRR